jgi:hypothetical protein
MPANSSADDQAASLSGVVVRRPFGTGSKSEHLAVSLDSGGRLYRLRRSGGNPFSDPVVERLVGKRVHAHGIVTGTDFIMTNWDEVADKGEAR